MNILKNLNGFKYTVTSIIIWLILYISSCICNCDIFETLWSILKKVEFYEVDELLIYSIIIILGFIGDLITHINTSKGQNHIKEQRLQTMQATMATVQDIIGNSFNGLQNIKLKIEIGEQLSNEDLAMFDQIIFETTERIVQLRELSYVDFKNITSKHIGLKTDLNSKFNLN